MNNENLEQQETDLTTGGGDPISPQEFAKKIKVKYPQYNNVDDLTLAKKMVEKFPEYKNKVNFNTPSQPKKVTAGGNGVSQSASANGGSLSGLPQPKTTLIQRMQEDQMSRPKVGQEQRPVSRIDQKVKEDVAAQQKVWNSNRPISQKVAQSVNPTQAVVEPTVPEPNYTENSVQNYVDRHKEAYKYDYDYYKPVDTNELMKVTDNFDGIDILNINDRDFANFLKNKTNYFTQDFKYDTPAQEQFAVNEYVNKYLQDRATYLKDKFVMADPETRKNIIDESKTLGAEYERFKKEVTPAYYKAEQEKKAENREFYENIKKGKNFSTDAKTTAVNLVKGATYALADMVSSAADVVGADDYADKLRFEKKFIEWSDENGTVTYAKGKNVKFKGNDYIVTDTGNIVDKQTKTSVNNFIDKSDMNEIFNMAEKSKTNDSVYSGRGYTYALANTVGNLAFQVLATKGVSGAAAKVGLTEANVGKIAATAPEMVTVGSMVASSTYNDTLEQLRKAGVPDEVAKGEAGKVAAYTATAGMIVTKFLPNTNANKILSTELNSSQLIRQAVSAFSAEGSKGVTELLKNSAKNFIFKSPEVIKEGAGEMFQELMENSAQKQGNYWVNSKLDQDILSTNWTKQEILDTAILSFAAGGMMGGLGKTRESFLGNNVQENFDILSGIDSAKFKEQGEILVNNGDITRQEFDDIKTKVENYKAYKNKLTDDVKGKTAVEVTQLMAERDKLKQDKKNLDEAFHPEIDAKIEALNGKIGETLLNPDTEDTSEVAPEPENQEESKPMFNEDIKTPEGFTNRVHDSFVQLGSPSEDSHVTEEGYTYRTVGQSEIDAIAETGGVFAREGKQKGGNSNTKYWTKGNGKNFYNADKTNVIRVADENIDPTKVVSANDLEILTDKGFVPFSDFIKPTTNEETTAETQSGLETDATRTEGQTSIKGETENTKKEFLIKDQKIIDRLRDAGIEDDIIHALPEDFRINDKWLMGSKGESLLSRLSKTATLAGQAFNISALDNKGKLKYYDNGEIDLNKFISFLSKAEGRKVLKHEAVHTATVMIMDDIKRSPELYSKEAVEALAEIEFNHSYYNDLFKEGYKLNPERASLYGLTNPYEFVAEFVSNPNFRKWIINKGNQIRNPRTTIQKIWDSIKAILGFKKNTVKFDNEALNDIQSSIDTLIKQTRQKYESDKSGTTDTNTDQETTGDQKGKNTSDESVLPTESSEEETITDTDFNKIDLSDQLGLKKAQDFLDNISKKLDDFGKGTLGINIPVVVLKGAVSAMKAAVKSAKVGADVISAGVNYVRQTDWYKRLNDSDRKEFDSKGLLSHLSDLDNKKVAESMVKSETSGKKPLKTSIREVTGQTDQSKKITQSEAQLLRDKFKNLQRGFKQGVKDTQALKREFIDQVKQSIKGLGNFITESDAKTMLNQVGNVNDNNIEKVSEVIENLVSRLENRAQKAKTNRLTKLQKRAGVKARTKYGNAGGNINKLIKLPANQIPDVHYDEYYNMMESLAKGEAVDFDKVNDLYESIKDDIQKFIENKNENKNKPKEPESEEVRQNKENDFKAAYTDGYKAHRNGRGNNLSDFERKIVKDFFQIPTTYLDSLPSAKLGQIAKSIEYLTSTGYLPNKVLSDVVMKYKAESTASDIMGKVGETVLRPVKKMVDAINKARGREYLSDDFFKKISNNMLHHIDSTIKGIKGTTFYDNIVHPITSGFNKSDAETNKIGHEVSGLLSKAAKKLGTGFKVNVRLQMFLRAREFESNPELRGTKVFSLDEHMRALEANRNNVEYSSADMEVINSVYDEFKNKTPEEMFNELTPEEKALVDFMDSRLSSQEISNRDYNNHLLGETLTYPKNYFPRKNSFVTGNEDTDNEVKARLFGMVGATSVKGDASNERVATQANPLDFNTMNTFMRSVRESNIEKNLAFSVKQTLMTVSTLKKSDNQSLVRVANALERTVKNLIDVQMNKNPYSYDSKSEQLFNKFVRNTFTRMLIDPIRLTYDVASNYSTVYGAFADKLPDIVKASKNIDNDVTAEIHKNISSIQSERLGGSRSSDYKNAMSTPLSKTSNRKAEPSFGERIVDLYKHNKLSEFSEAMGDVYYKYADLPAQHLWKYFLSTEYNQMTGKYFDGKKYLSDQNYREEVQDDLQKAAVAADKKTANYFNTGSSSEQKLKVQAGRDNWFNRMNNFLRSFTFNENKVFWDSLNGLTGFGSTTFDKRSDAFRAFTVINARGIMYAYLGQVIGDWLTKFVTDDEEEEELLNKKALKRSLGQHGMLIALGNKGAVANFMGTFLGEMINQEIVKAENGKYNTFEDNIFFTPNKKSKYVDFLNNLGAEGLAVKTLVESGDISLKIVEKFWAGEEITKEDLVRMKAARISTSMVSQTFGLPIDRLGRLTQKALDKKYPYKEKKSSGKNKGFNSFGTMGGSGFGKF